MTGFLFYVPIGNKGGTHIRRYTISVVPADEPGFFLGATVHVGSLTVKLSDYDPVFSPASEIAELLSWCLRSVYEREVGLCEFSRRLGTNTFS